MNKLQFELIKHLEKQGSVKLILPGGLTVEIGVNQLNEAGELVNVENYAWIMASRDDNKSAILDCYNIGLRFSNDGKSLVFEDDMIDSEGNSIKLVDVI